VGAFVPVGSVVESRNPANPALFTCTATYAAVGFGLRVGPYTTVSDSVVPLTVRFPSAAVPMRLVNFRLAIGDGKPTASTSGRLAVDLPTNHTDGQQLTLSVTLSQSLFINRAYFSQVGGQVSGGYRAGFSRFTAAPLPATPPVTFSASPLADTFTVLLAQPPGGLIVTTERTPRLGLLQLLGEGGAMGVCTPTLTPHALADREATPLSSPASPPPPCRLPAGILWGILLGVVVCMKVTHDVFDGLLECGTMRRDDALFLLTCGRRKKGAVLSGDAGDAVGVDLVMGGDGLGPTGPATASRSNDLVRAVSFRLANPVSPPTVVRGGPGGMSRSRIPPQPAGGDGTSSAPPTAPSSPGEGDATAAAAPASARPKSGRLTDALSSLAAAFGSSSSPSPAPAATQSLPARPDAPAPPATPPVAPALPSPGGSNTAAGWKPNPLSGSGGGGTALITSSVTLVGGDGKPIQRGLATPSLYALAARRAAGGGATAAPATSAGSAAGSGVVGEVTNPIRRATGAGK